MVLRFMLPIALPIPESTSTTPLPSPLPTLPINSNIGLKLRLLIWSIKALKPLPIFWNIFPIEVSPLRIPSDNFPNILLAFALSFILVRNLPKEEVAVRMISLIPPNIPTPGANALNKLTTPVLTKSTTENKPLKVSFILAAVLSLTLSFSVNFSNPFDRATSFSPVIAGNTSLKPSLTEPSTFPKLPNAFPNPFITASLPPF